MLGSLSSGSSGPRPGHLVEDFGDELVELLGVERQPLDHDVLRDELLDVRPHLVLGQLFQRREVDLLDQPAVQADLGVEQLVGEQRIGRLGRELVLGRLRRGQPSRTSAPAQAAALGHDGAGSGDGAASER